MKLRDRILKQLATTPGATDRELTNLVHGRTAPQQSINSECRFLAQTGVIERRQRVDGRIGNYLVKGTLPRLADTELEPVSALYAPPTPGVARSSATDALLSEDQIKGSLQRWLAANGWSTAIAWAKTRGIDIEAKRGTERWVIEVKGCGSLQPMRVNYFLAILGETLQRMDHAGSRYSIALPDIAQFRGLWARLAALAKERTGITLLLIGHGDSVIELA